MAEKDAEMAQNHIIQITCLVAIATVLIIDSLLGIFDLGTTPLLGFIPWYVRLILFGIFMFFCNFGGRISCEWWGRKNNCNRCSPSWIFAEIGGYPRISRLGSSLIP